MKSRSLHDPVSEFAFLICIIANRVSMSDARRLFESVMTIPDSWYDTLDDALKEDLACACDHLLAMAKKAIPNKRHEVEGKVFRTLQMEVLTKYPAACEISMDEILYGFDADIVIKTPAGALVNVEVTEPLNSNPVINRYTSRRDEILLKRHKVKVVRVSTRDIGRMTEEDLAEHLQALVAVAIPPSSLTLEQAHVSDTEAAGMSVPIPDEENVSVEELVDDAMDPLSASTS